MPNRVHFLLFPSFREPWLPSCSALVLIYDPFSLSLQLQESLPSPLSPSSAPGSAEEGAAFSVGGVCSRWGWQSLAVLAGWGWNTGLSSGFLCGLVLPTPTLPPVPMSHCCALMEAERQQSPPSCYKYCLAERVCLRIQCRENSTWGG